MDKFRFFLVLLLVANGDSTIAQCDACSSSIGIVPADRSTSFMENYRSTFWKTSYDSIVYSESVEFSRAELKMFFSKNSGANYCGFNIYFLSGELTNRQNHVNENQIGLALVPRLKDKKPDFTAYLAESMAFNLKGGHGNRGGNLRTIGIDRVDTLRARFKRKYPLGTDSNHTRYVLVGEGTTWFLKEFLKDRRYSQFKTFRFYFISYKADSIVCGQANIDQISILITPVSDTGPDFSAFENYFYIISKKKRMNLLLNHGSLCPNYCPDGDTN